MGHETYIIDVGVRKSVKIKPDISREAVTDAAGIFWSDIRKVQKHEIIDGLVAGIAVLLPQLYEAGAFDGVISIGGAQNTSIAVSGMKKLPIGVPKVMVSTVACGQRRFEDLVGTKDIVVIPAIADIAGINKITRIVLGNAAAAVCGMSAYEGKTLDNQENTTIGLTLMGVINDGAVQAIKILEENHVEVVSFHSTGVGGMIMEELITAEAIHGVMDLSLHEITAEMFNMGYSLGATDRLASAGRAGIPQVICPGAVDFIDFAPKDIPQYLKDRKRVVHNSGITHIKLSKEEIIQVGLIISKRLNASVGPVTVIIPLKGFRQDTRPGEALYDKGVDDALIQTLHRHLKKGIKIVEVDANINDLAFSEAAAAEMIGMRALWDKVNCM